MFAKLVATALCIFLAVEAFSIITLLKTQPVITAQEPATPTTTYQLSITDLQATQNAKDSSPPPIVEMPAPGQPPGRGSNILNPAAGSKSAMPLYLANVLKHILIWQHRILDNLWLLWH